MEFEFLILQFMHEKWSVLFEKIDFAIYFLRCRPFYISLDFTVFENQDSKAQLGELGIESKPEVVCRVFL